MVHGGKFMNIATTIHQVFFVSFNLLLSMMDWFIRFKTNSVYKFKLNRNICSIFSVNSVCWAHHDFGLMLACGSSDGSISVLSSTGKLCFIYVFLWLFQSVAGCIKLSVSLSVPLAIPLFVCLSIYFIGIAQ